LRRLSVSVGRSSGSRVPTRPSFAKAGPRTPGRFMTGKSSARGCLPALRSGLGSDRRISRRGAYDRTGTRFASIEASAGSWLACCSCANDCCARLGRRKQVATCYRLDVPRVRNRRSTSKGIASSCRLQTTRLWLSFQMGHSSSWVTASGDCHRYCWVEWLPNTHQAPVSHVGVPPLFRPPPGGERS